MSYILNALRKSEQERASHLPDTLGQSILEKNEPSQKKTSIWLIVLVVFNIILLAFILWVFSQQDGPEIDQNIEPILKPSEKTVKVIKKQEPVLNPVFIETKKTSQQVSIEDKIKQTKKAVQLVEYDVEKIQPIKVQDADKEISSVTIEPKKTVTAIKVSQTIEKDKPNKIPFLSELSYEFRREVPEININVFVYTENKKDRFIMLGMNKYVIDQQILSGMKLNEIRMDSIIVEYKSKVFRVKRK